MQFKANDGEQSLRISLDPQESDPPREENPAARSFTSRRRDRHGRGLRGPVLDAGLPGSRTRGQKFDDLVVDSADRLRSLWPEALATVEYLVEEVPERLESLLASGAQAPLGKYVPARPATAGNMGEPASIAIYRHPVEALCDNAGQVRELVHEVLVEQVAGLLNIDPDAVDPLFRHHRGH
ncbi:metallopeptidase family protein [Arthrobacter sp. N199823]|uniref:metallopeptidase family protein n=1 Tax=Arthrobacter sp. N199823 TaxID=2058895 RepID=UPI000CE3E8F1|nr:metallopeptidase family protein [Arthrobacter sp. N199823]